MGIGVVVSPCGAADVMAIKAMIAIYRKYLRKFLLFISSKAICHNFVII
jgi:hypothetical protein